MGEHSLHDFLPQRTVVRFGYTPGFFAHNLFPINARQQFLQNMSLILLQSTESKKTVVISLLVKVLLTTTNNLKKLARQALKTCRD